MKCKYCNSDIKEDTKFCPSCGRSVSDIKVSNTLAIASLVLGVLSIIGGFTTLIIPIVGLILGLCQKEKCTERTIGITLNSIGIVLALLLGGVVVSLFSIFNNIVKNGNFDDIRKKYNIDYIEKYEDLYGKWESKNDKEKIIELNINNTFSYINKDEISGIFTAEKLEDSQIDETLINKVESLVDGRIDEYNKYYVKLVSNKANTKTIDLIFIRIDDEDEYFIYNINDETFDYYIEYGEYFDDVVDEL